MKMVGELVENAVV